MGQGRKKSAGANDLFEEVREFVATNPSSPESSITQLRKKFGLARGAAGRIVTEDLSVKSFTKAKAPRLCKKKKETRAEWRAKFLGSRNQADLDSVFYTDGRQFRGGKPSRNRRNNRIRVPKSQKQGRMDPSEIVETAAWAKL